MNSLAMPGSRDLRPGSPVTIAVAAPADLDAIEQLELTGFDHGAWSRDAWAAELAGADRQVLVAGPRGAVVGVSTVQCVADTADLHRVIVAPHARGRGIGRQLVSGGLAWARTRGAERMLLEVEETNLPARALYAALGFVEIARRAHYYGQERHALVLERDLREGGDRP